MHARSGGILEVMGLMLGKVDGNTMIVMDSFALPVEGTETRVNAQAQAYEYMAAYIESAKTVSIENWSIIRAVGWDQDLYYRFHYVPHKHALRVM
jgi:COP9 signalosome complex subunit 5